MPVTNKMKGLISADASEQDIMKAAVEAGMTLLQNDGLKKVASGVTTLEELVRVIHLTRDDQGEAGVCPVCYKGVSAESDACQHCGHLLLKACPTCGKNRRPDWIVCPYCSAKF